MRAAQPTPVTDLPALDDLMAFEEFSRDFVQTARELIRQDGTGLLKGPENSLVVLRNKDVRALAANPAVGNMPADVLFWMATEMDLGSGPVVKPDPEQTAGFGQFLRNQVFTSNPPLHQPSRNVLVRQLMPKNIMRFVPAAQRLADELVEQCAGREQIDFSREFAGRLATGFWAEQLGLSTDLAAHIQELIEEMNLTFLLSRTPEQSQRMFSAVATYMDVVGDAVREAWAKGDNELLTGMAADLAAIDVQIKIKHPSRTGLELREGKFVQAGEPLYLKELNVFYGDAQVSRFTLTSALSDHPLITFRLRARAEDPLRVVLTNNLGQRFEAVHSIRFS